MKRILAALVLAVASLTLTGGVAYAGEGEHVPVSICHRTASDTNPYVFITVDDDALSPGHLDNADPGHKPTYWKSDGTWRGVDHVVGDPKDDYLAESKADCEDIAPPPPPPCEEDCSPPPPPPCEGDECGPPDKNPPVDPPVTPPKEPPGDCDADCPTPDVAYTGFDAGDAAATAVLLAACGGMAWWVSRKLRVR